MSLLPALLFALASAQAQPPKEAPLPDKLHASAAEEDAPTVSIHSSKNGDRVEEYREGGRITMVKITPLHGRPYYLYDDDRNGRLDRTDADRASVSPVYWTVYQWD